MLFKCEKCGCIDSSNVVNVDDTGYLCTECLTGEWHHLFEKERYDPMFHSQLLNVEGPLDEDGSEVSLG